MPSGAVFVSTIGTRCSRRATSGKSGVQNCPRPPKMKVDHLRRRLFRRANEIPFVFAVLRVNDDNHLALGRWHRRRTGLWKSPA